MWFTRLKSLYSNDVRTLTSLLLEPPRPVWLPSEVVGRGVDQGRLVLESMIELKLAGVRGEVERASACEVVDEVGSEVAVGVGSESEVGVGSEVGVAQLNVSGAARLVSCFGREPRPSGVCFVNPKRRTAISTSLPTPTSIPTSIPTSLPTSLPTSASIPIPDTGDTPGGGRRRLRPAVRGLSRELAEVGDQLVELLREREQLLACREAHRFSNHQRGQRFVRFAARLPEAQARVAASALVGLADAQCAAGQRS